MVQEPVEELRVSKTIEMLETLENIFYVADPNLLAGELFELEKKEFKEFSNIKMHAENRNKEVIERYANWLFKEMIKYSDKIRPFLLLNSGFEKIEKNEDGEYDIDMEGYTEFEKELKKKLCEKYVLGE